MCRLSAFFGEEICAADLVTRPSRSIITQSFDARERMTGDASTPAYLNGDGFGLGWYSTNSADPLPCVYRQARPAWNDPNLSSIAEKLFTRLLFAHVRAASAGLDVSESTCHPFKYGRYLFMHNGGLGGFSVLRRILLSKLSSAPFDFAVSHGCSDTALCFAVFLNVLGDPLVPQTPDKLRTCLETTIGIIERAQLEANITDTSLLNFVLSDGESLIATRYVISLNNPSASPASLYYASGNSYESDGTAPGNYVMKHTDRRATLTIVSSEPLTESRSDWVSVPRNFCIVVTKSMHVLLSALRPAPIGKPDDVFSRILATLSVGKKADVIGSTPRRLEHRSSHLRDAILSPTRTLKGGTLSTVTSWSRLNNHHSSAQQTVFCAEGAAVRSSITIPDCTVLCCTVLDSLLCSGTNNGDVHVWDMDANRKHSILITGCNAVQSLLGDSETKFLVCGTSVSTVLVFKLSRDGEFQRAFDVCCNGMGNIISLARVGHHIFAGFSDAGLRCVIRDIREGIANAGDNGTKRIGRDGVDDTLCDTNTSSTITSVVNLKDVGYDFPKGSPTIVHKGFIFSLVPFQDGRFLCSGCGDGILRVWDTEQETCVQMRNDHAGAILALAVYEIPRGTMLFSGSRDCSVKVWLWDGDRGFNCKRTLRKHKDEVVFLAVAGSILVSGSADGAVYVWNAETLHLICQYRDNGLKAGGVSMEYNSLFTATNYDGIQVRDIISMERNLKQRESGRNMLFDEEIDCDSTVVESSRLLPSRENGFALEKPVSDTATGKQNREVVSNVESLLNRSNSVIVSEMDDDSDEAESLVPGVENEEVLAPPMLLETNGTTHSSLVNSISKMLPRNFEQRLIEDALRRFVSFATVANSDHHRESCWEGARYIGRFLEVMGASVKYVNTSSRNGSSELRDDIPSKMSKRDARTMALELETNPIVLARFAAANPSAETITFYGHYDVMPAMDLSQWETDPWEMKGVDGYLYGRGTTDNKGPIMAMVFAVRKLMEESANGLGVNIVLVLQGEAEASNAGFRECVTSHLHWFERTCLILTSNSTWLGENRPCLTYGFRGVIDLLVSVKGGGRNLHSGVDGGAIFEPINDLITLLGTLVDASGVVCVPGFYDDVRPLSTAERVRLHSVDFDVDEYRRATGVERFTAEGATEVLECRWRKPSVSITAVETSNTSGFFSVVPQHARAKISIRFVPDQDPSKIEKAVQAHLHHELGKRRSPNTLEVQCVNRGDWWLRDPSGEEFQVAARAVRQVWGVDAEYVCEGGSMPLFTFLAETLEAPLVQVPLGQSSDGAHLPNERIRAVNLFRGKEVLQHIVSEYSSKAKAKQ